MKQTKTATTTMTEHVLHTQKGQTLLMRLFAATTNANAVKAMASKSATDKAEEATCIFTAGANSSSSTAACPPTARPTATREIPVTSVAVKEKRCQHL
jgi:LytS/YehU family sensor histidine kinase